MMKGPSEGRGLAFICRPNDTDLVKIASWPMWRHVQKKRHASVIGLIQELVDPILSNLN